ncbi:hypothetical protein SAMN04488700_0951 [Carnobacterium iners]|uniref:Uncharacterized protein n=1 Tax=Carnobacterium iners TaxID=1073423 RepID=A0A1X7MUU4_9LACT|nr:hypothetical protein SAMN04488114_1364 [Carnobacterium iners]SMH28628.1 hypothetical protein SAMN04488700_0951 [Carnobacterium iners]
MIKIFGKKYTLNNLLYFYIFLCSIVIIFLNGLYFILFKESLINWNMVWVLSYLFLRQRVYSLKKARIKINKVTFY